MNSMGVKRSWRALCVAGWILTGLLLATWTALLQPFNPRWLAAHRQRLTRHWMRTLIRLLPLRIRCHGTAPNGTTLWVSNHVSWLDIVVLGAQAPVHFLSKAEVRHWPVIGWLAAAAGTLFIRRGQGSGAQLQEQLSHALNQGRSLVLFAEGTTTAGDQVRTFHARMLACALTTGTPVQPVAIAYRYNGQRDQYAPFIGDDEFTRHLWRLLGCPGVIEVEVYFLSLLDSQGNERNQLARQAQSAVAQALGLPDSSARKSGSDFKAAA